MKLTDISINLEMADSLFASMERLISPQDKQLSDLLYITWGYVQHLSEELYTAIGEREGP